MPLLLAHYRLYVYELAQWKLSPIPSAAGNIWIFSCPFILNVCFAHYTHFWLLHFRYCLCRYTETKWKSHKYIWKIQENSSLSFLYSQRIGKRNHVLLSYLNLVTWQQTCFPHVESQNVKRKKKSWQVRSNTLFYNQVLSILYKTGITHVLIRDFWHLNVSINVGILLVLRYISDLHMWCSTVCQHWLNWNAYVPHYAPLILHKESLHLCKQIQQTGTISGPCKGVKISLT